MNYCIEVLSFENRETQKIHHKIHNQGLVAGTHEVSYRDMLPNSQLAVKLSLGKEGLVFEFTFPFTQTEIDTFMIEMTVLLNLTIQCLKGAAVETKNILRGLEGNSTHSRRVVIKQLRNLLNSCEVEIEETTTMNLFDKKSDKVVASEEDKEVARLYLQAHEKRMLTSYKDDSFEYFTGPTIYERFKVLIGERYKNNILRLTIMCVLGNSGQSRDKNSCELEYLCKAILGEIDPFGKEYDWAFNKQQ